MDPHMVVISIYVGKNLVEDVLLNGGSIVIIIDNLMKRLWHTPKLFERLRCESEGENNGRMSWGMLFNS